MKEISGLIRLVIKEPSPNGKISKNKEIMPVQLAPNDLAPRTPGVVSSSLTDHMAENLANVNKITAALASMPTTVFGGLVGIMGTIIVAKAMHH